jgi:Secretion system C-terminal sorting domain
MAMDYIRPGRIILLSLFILSNHYLLFGQAERIILSSNGTQHQIDPRQDIKESIITSKFTTSNSSKSTHSFLEFKTEGIIDTLNYYQKGLFNSNFSFMDQDVEFVWFEAPSDLIIKAAGFSCGVISETATDPKVSLRLIKLNWTKEQLLAIKDPLYMGYYPDNDGMNNSEPFGEVSNNSWVDKTGGIHPTPPWEHSEYDLWSNNGLGVNVEPVIQPAANNYQWIEMSLLGDEPTLKRGEIFAVVLSHDGIAWESSDNKISFWYERFTGYNYNSWKYYEAGRNNIEDPGWWVRQLSLDFAVVVDITGDRGPTIVEFTNLETTISTEPRLVEAIITDDNLSGGSAGVKNVKMKYSTDSGISWNEIEMYGSEPNFSGELPGFTQGTEILYKITAEDVNGLISESVEKEFFIFKPYYKNILIVFNGYSETVGYPQSYYFGIGDFDTFGSFEFYKDSWSYGPLTEELVNYYTKIIEITTSGPKHNNNKVIGNWLQNSCAEYYMLIGDEYLSYHSNGIDESYTNGDFQYDVLGIKKVFNDISIQSPGDEVNPTIVLPIENSLLGGELFDEYNRISLENGWTEPIYYNPTDEIGINNYLDGFDVRDDTKIDMQAIGIDGNTYNIGSHRNFDNDTKIVLLSYDALSISSGDRTQVPEYQYYWYGFTEQAPQVEAIKLSSLGECFIPDPLVYDVTKLSNTISTSSRNISAYVDDNPCQPNCPNDLSVVEIQYSINGSNYISQQMTQIDYRKFIGTIPGQIAGSVISYRVNAKDNSGNSTYNEETFIYRVLPTPKNNNLIILQDYEGNDSLMVLDYFKEDGIPVEFEFVFYPKDGLDDALFYSYDNIYNFTTYNKDSQDFSELKNRIKYWINTFEGKNYFASGGNFLGSFYNKAIYNYHQGTSEYGIFGVNKVFSSINAIDYNDSSFFYSPTKIFGMDNSQYGDHYFEFSNNDSLIYKDPYINKIDGFEASDDVVVDFKAIGYDGNQYNVGGHRMLDNGNKVVFLCFDPISIYLNDSSSSFMDSISTLPYIAKEWFDLTTDIIDRTLDIIPTDYYLSQNYPNPFNPTTAIKYSIPSSNVILNGVKNLNVKLIVYDILGREVKTIVNEVKQPGNYEVVFDGSNLSNGIYYYQLKADNFNKTKKMVILK